jgi:hypothetical protein
VPRAQKTLPQNPFRAESEVLDKEVPYNIFPLGQLGVVTISAGTVAFYDENLKLRWNTGFSLNKSYNCVAYRPLNDSLHFIFYNKDKFVHLWVSCTDGNGAAKYLDITLADNDNVEGVQIFEDRAMLLLSNKDKFRFLIYRYGSDTFATKEIPLPGGYACSNVVFDTVSGMSYAVFNSASYKDDGLLLAISDTSIDSVAVSEVRARRGDIRLLNGSVVVLGGNVILSGIWNYNKSKQDISYYDKGISSMGIYAAICKNGIVDSSTMVLKSYTEFPKNKNASFLAQSRIVSLDSGFAVLAEMYERKFSTTTETYYDAYGRMIPYTRTFYEGVSFTNVFCGMFSPCNVQRSLLCEGLYVFDVSNDNIYSAPFPYSAFARDSFGNILYAFPSEGRAYYRALPAAPATQDTAHTIYLQDVSGGRLTSLYSGDKVQKNWNNRIITWYNGCFLAYGYQQILNHKAPRTTRNVFYLNKLLMGWR